MAPHDDLMATAMAQTGLEDFGDDSFREGLEILVRSLHGEARLNETGEAFIYPRLVNHLSQRLQIEDWYRRHPEIDDVPIVAPLIGMGLPRTGSTALSFLLAQDPNVRYLRQWESSQPCPPPSTVDGPDPRIPHAGGEERAGTKQHVPADINGPMECLDLMALDFKTHIYQAFAQIPSYSSWLLDADLTSTYLYERRVLKLLQWGEPPRPWRLKTPTHILFLEDLDRAFPDARFVMTHRDPTDVILSVADVYADIAGVFTDHLDREYMGRLERRALVGRHASESWLFATAVPTIASTTSASSRCAPIRSERSAHCTRGSANRSPPSSRPGCAPGGRRTPRTTSPALTPTRQRTDWTSTKYARCSPTTSHASKAWTSHTDH